MNTPSERNNKVRLIRALEIASCVSQTSTKAAIETPYDALWIGTDVPFEILEQKIATRLHARVRRGMIAEAKRLHANGLSYKRMEALGLEYRSLARLLQNRITRPQFIDELLHDIRRYAKHQLMYWKRNHDIVWMAPDSKKAEILARKHLAR
jgi:tRNA dimethylallyltransferase